MHYSSKAKINLFENKLLTHSAVNKNPETLIFSLLSGGKFKNITWIVSFSDIIPSKYISTTMYFAEHFAIEHLFIRKINFKFRSGLSEEWTKYYIHSQRVLHSSLFKIKFFLKEKFCVQLCHILGVVLLFFKNFFYTCFNIITDLNLDFCSHDGFCL